MVLVPDPRKDDWTRVRQIIQKLSTKLSPTSEPTFAGLTMTGLTASRLLSTDANKELVSVSNLASWVAGTANEINITNDGDGTITIGIINPLIVAKGGIGVATLTDHGILLGSGTGAITPLGAAANGQLPIGSAGADPVLATLTGTANQINVANAAGSITLSTPQDIHTGAIPTFAGLNLTGLIQNRLLVIDANENLQSVDELSTWIYGTFEELVVTDNGAGAVTLSIANEYTALYVPYIGASGNVNLGSHSLVLSGNIQGGQSSCSLYFGAATDMAFSSPEDESFRPYYDAQSYLGEASYRWKRIYGADIYATTFHAGTLSIADGLITDTDGTISFGDEDLITTGTATIGDATHFLDMSSATIPYTVGPFIKLSGKVAEGFTSGLNRVAAGHEFFILVGDSTIRTVFGSGVDGDDYRRITIAANGEIQWGSGAAMRDTKLYRKAANELATWDNFTIFRDNVKLSLGATITDLQLYSDGTNGIINVATALRLGNNVTNYAEYSATGSLVFVGSAGLVYGDIYGLDETITCTNEDAWYQITFDTAGPSNNTTVSTADDDITIIKTGTYKIGLTVRCHSAVAHDFEVMVKKNNGTVDIVSTHLFQSTSVANQIENISGNCINSLTAGDTIEAWVQCTDAAGIDFIIDHVNLNITQIGGA